MKEVGKRLKALREGVGVSQVKLAEALGSTQSSINRHENGQSTPSVELFRRYADYFDVSLDYHLCPDGQAARSNVRVQAEGHHPTKRKCGASLKCALTRNLP